MKILERCVIETTRVVGVKCDTCEKVIGASDARAEVTANTPYPEMGPDALDFCSSKCLALYDGSDYDSYRVIVFFPAPFFEDSEEEWTKLKWGSP